MREETMEVNGVTVYLDDGVRDWTACERPYYRLRGKHVTEEQAFEVIRRTDSFFSVTLGMDKRYEECIRDLNFSMCWFDFTPFQERYGWIHPNGIVGVNAFTSKYPTIEEFIKEWTTYVRNFPFLDLVVGVTWWNERCTERWEKEDNIWKTYTNGEFSDEEFDKQSEILDFTDLERKEFEEAVQIGIWVHDKTVEIMNAERTIKVYLNYEKQYEEQDTRIYMPEYYLTFQSDNVTRAYLHRCIAAYGITDPEKLIQEKTRPYETENLK